MLNSDEFAAVMQRLRGAYSDWISEEQWRAKLDAFRAGLGSYPDEVLHEAISAVVSERPDRFPTLGQLAAMCDARMKRWRDAKADEMRGRMLPAGPSTRGAALQAYYSACDESVAKLRGQCSEDHRWKLEGLVVLLGAIFGLDRAHVTGSKGAFNFAAYMATEWIRNKQDVESVVRGLRSAPRWCVQFPTHGILMALSRGEHVRGWGSEWIDDSGNAAAVAA